MNHTTNLNLPQWEKTDRIMMDDFNDAMASIDAALAANTAALLGKGNCRIVYGCYTGTGAYGSSNKNTLTFEGKPLFVFVRQQVGSSSTAGDGKLLMLWDADWCKYLDAQSNCHVFVSWNDNSVSWYCSASAAYQANSNSTSYAYVALLAEGQ